MFFHEVTDEFGMLHVIISFDVPYKWIYWQVKYLAICFKNSVGVILIWQNSSA